MFALRMVATIKTRLYQLGEHPTFDETLKMYYRHNRVLLDIF